MFTFLSVFFLMVEGAYLLKACVTYFVCIESILSVQSRQTDAVRCVLKGLRLLKKGSLFLILNIYCTFNLVL